VSHQADASGVDAPGRGSGEEPVTWRRSGSAFKIRNYRYFLTGQLLSSTGLWMQRIAQDWVVLTLTNSPTAVGVTTALQFLPTALFGLVGGAMADRHSKRHVLLVTQTLMGLMSGLLAVLTIGSSVTVWEVYVIAFAFGTAAAFDMPTRQAFVNELVGVAQLRSAISLNSAVFQLGALIGPAISGALIEAVGPGWSFAVNAISYLGPILAILLMRASELSPMPARQNSEPTRQQIRAGLQYVRSRPEIMWLTVLAGVFGMFISSLPVTNAALARGEFHRGAGGYGLLSSVVAVGSIAGAVFAASRGRVRLRGTLSAGFAMAGLYILASVAPGLWGYAIVAAGIGVATMTLITSTNSTVQLASADAMRGRVMGLYMLVFVGSGAIGGPLIGALDQLFSPRIGLLAGGVIPGAATLFVTLRLAKACGLQVRVTRSRTLSGLVSVSALPPLISPLAGGPDVDRPGAQHVTTR
jgi:MFS family permease